MLTGNLDYENIVPSFIHMVNRYCNATWNVKYQTHSFHNFMFVVSGQGTVTTDGKKYPMTPGMLVYNYPGQSFGFETCNPNFMHCFGVNFNITHVISDNDSYKIETIDKLPFDTFTHFNNTDLIIKHFTNLVDIWENKGLNYKIRLNNAFENILLEISSTIFRSQNNLKTVEIIELIIDYINNNYTNKITLNQLSLIADLNPNYLSGLFKKYTKMTPVEYVNYIRCEKAKQFLSLKYPVYQVATMVGFSDNYYFCRVFKKVTGISPGKYAKIYYSFF